MGTGFFPGGKERPGRDADPLPPSSAVGHERVELYLYSPYGPYGMYRASVPVQGWALPYLFTFCHETQRNEASSQNTFQNSIWDEITSKPAGQKPT